MNKTANDTKFIDYWERATGATGALFSTVFFLYAGDWIARG